MFSTRLQLRSPRELTRALSARSPLERGYRTRLRPNSFLFCLNLPAEGGAWPRPRASSPGQAEQRLSELAKSTPTSFAIHRLLPSPHHVTTAWTPGLFFPLGAAPPRRRLGAHSFELRNNEPRARRLRELPRPARAPEAASPHWSPQPARARGRHPPLGPAAGSGESNFPEPSGTPGPSPAPAPSPPAPTASATESGAPPPPPLRILSAAAVQPGKLPGGPDGGLPAGNTVPSVPRVTARAAAARPRCSSPSLTHPHPSETQRPHRVRTPAVGRDSVASSLPARSPTAAHLPGARHDYHRRVYFSAETFLLTKPVAITKSFKLRLPPPLEPPGAEPSSTVFVFNWSEELPL